MGLDMYLYREVYVGANHEHRNVQGIIKLKYTFNSEIDETKDIEVNFNKVVSITELVKYWRKANAIHGWFVNNIQGGNDNCHEHWVRRSDLEELYQVCNEIMNIPEGVEREALAMKLLPPVGGFFFGSTIIDEWYWKDLKETLEMLESELDNIKDNYEISYKYQSSW